MLTIRRLASALLLGAAACGGDGGGTEPIPITGSYTLRTVNGTSLPLPSTYLCGEILTRGRLEIDTDSVVRTHWISRGEATDPTVVEWRGSYEKASDRMLVVSYSTFSVIRDTISVLGGGRVTQRAWLALPVECAGKLLTQVDFGFTHD